MNNCHASYYVTEKRRFMRETVPEPADVDAEPAGKVNSQQAVTAADTVVNDSIKSAAATSSLLNGHTTVGHQPSENNYSTKYDYTLYLPVQV